MKLDRLIFAGSAVNPPRVPGNRSSSSILCEETFIPGWNEPVRMRAWPQDSACAPDGLNAIFPVMGQL